MYYSHSTFNPRHLALASLINPVLCCILSKFQKVIMLKLCADRVCTSIYQVVFIANDLPNSSEEGRSHDIVSIEFKN
jgi:hypothetical protein